jgi:uncharacterized repeat protein (TIGR02543 family)
MKKFKIIIAVLITAFFAMFGFQKISAQSGYQFTVEPKIQNRQGNLDTPVYPVNVSFFSAFGRRENKLIFIEDDIRVTLSLVYYAYGEIILIDIYDNATNEHIIQIEHVNEQELQEYITFDVYGGDIKYLTDLREDVESLTFNFVTMKIESNEFDAPFDFSNWEGVMEFIIYPKQEYIPVFSGNENFVTSVDDPKPLSFFLSYITAYDYVDGDLTDDIIVDEDNYTANMNEIGQYSVKLSVSDSADNTSYFVFYINVVDITAPVITGVKDLYTPNSKKLTETEILTNIIATDNVDGDLTDEIYIDEDNYSDYYDVPNTTNNYYTVVIAVVDSSGNKATEEIKIYVVLDESPVWYIYNGATVFLEEDAELTRQQIIDLLFNTGQIDSNQVQFLEDNYTANIGTQGVYQMAFLLFGSTYNVNIVLGGEGLDTFTVEFYVESELYDTVNVVEGQTIIPPTAPKKEDYTFVGWYKDEELTIPFKPSDPVTENIILYAKFLPKDQGGGTPIFGGNLSSNDWIMIGITAVALLALVFIFAPKKRK